MKKKKSLITTTLGVIKHFIGPTFSRGFIYLFIYFASETKIYWFFIIVYFLYVWSQKIAD